MLFQLAICACAGTGDYVLQCNCTILVITLNFPFGLLDSIAGRRGDYEAPANQAAHNHPGKRSNACSFFDLLYDISLLA
jgi:hypothetical protein